LPYHCWMNDGHLFFLSSHLANAPLRKCCNLASAK
jgi:hypothetical protein